MAAPDAAGFSPVAFRTGIQFAMKMGLDIDTPDGAVFIMAPPVSGSGTDAQGVPWDPDLVGLLPASAAEIPAVCGIEFFNSAGVNTAGIETETARVLVTILDDDWAPVAACIAIRLGDRIYRRNFKQPPLGLFSVGIHQISFWAGDI